MKKTPNTKTQTPKAKPNRTTGGVSNGIRLTCGMKESRAHSFRPARQQAAEKWERLAGDHAPIVGASLAVLEARLASNDNDRTERPDATI